MELILVILLSRHLTFLMILSVTDYRSSFGSGAVILDDCNFHESVRLDNFEVDKTLTLVREIESDYSCLDYRYSINLINAIEQLNTCSMLLMPGTPGW